MDVLLVFLLFGVASGWGAFKKGRNKYLWFVFGLLLGPFGLIVFALPKPAKEKPKTSNKMQSLNAFWKKHMDGLRTIFEEAKRDYAKKREEAMLKKVAAPFKITMSVNKSYDDTDNWEGAFWDAENPIPRRRRVKIKYIDGRGSKTDRIVHIREFDENFNGGMIIGHCHLRGETRTFRTDRIVELTDLESGEVVKDAHSYLVDLYRDTPEYSVSRIFEEEEDTMLILFYVAKADGQFRAEERLLIVNMLIEQTGDQRITKETLEWGYRQYDVPTFNQFKKYVGTVAKNGSKIDVLEISEKIIGTQKSVHLHEQAALDYLYKKFDKLEVEASV